MSNDIENKKKDQGEMNGTDGREERRDERNRKDGDCWWFIQTMLFIMEWDDQHGEKGGISMSETWHASIQGIPWNAEKMDQAVNLLRRRGTVHFRVGADTFEDLAALDTNVFAARPDLILHISNADPTAAYSSGFLGRLAQLKHVSALQLDLLQTQDLTILHLLHGTQDRQVLIYFRRKT